MENIAYYNGRVSTIEDMMVLMNDRACFLGDGVYDVTAVMEHVPLALDDHIDRFYNSARLVGIEPPLEKAALRSLLKELVNRVDSPTQFLYWQVSRGVGPRGHAFRFAGATPSLWVFSRPHTFVDVTKDYKAITMEDTRFFHCNIKTIDLLPNVLAAQRAEEAGCAETILHRNGRVTECAHSNVHILKNGTLITAPLDNLILPGVARKHILAICRKLGIPVEERPYMLAELLNADEIFFSSSSAATCRIVEVDGRPAGGRDLETFVAIRDAYQAEMRAEAAGA